MSSCNHFSRGLVIGTKYNISPHFVLKNPPLMVSNDVFFIISYFSSSIERFTSHRVLWTAVSARRGALQRARHSSAVESQSSITSLRFKAAREALTTAASLVPGATLKGQ